MHKYPFMSDLTYLFKGFSFGAFSQYPVPVFPYPVSVCPVSEFQLATRSFFPMQFSHVSHTIS